MRRASSSGWVVIRGTRSVLAKLNLLAAKKAGRSSGSSSRSMRCRSRKHSGRAVGSSGIREVWGLLQGWYLHLAHPAHYEPPGCPALHRNRITPPLTPAIFMLAVEGRCGAALLPGPDATGGYGGEEIQVDLHAESTPDALSRQGTQILHPSQYEGSPCQCDFPIIRASHSVATHMPSSSRQPCFS